MSPRLEELWGAHKRFILALGGGLVVLLLALSAKASFETASRRWARQNLLIERNIETLAASLEDREGYALGVEEVLAREVGPDVRGRVELAAREGFVLAGGESEGIVHYQALERVKAAEAAARKNGVAMPQGGLGLDEKPAPERIPDELALLDACERLLTAIGVLRVPRVESFRPGAAEYIQLVEPAAARPSGDGEAGGSAGAAGPDWLLRRLPMTLAVAGPLDTVQALLASVQRAGSLYEVGALRFERLDGEEVRLEVELAALALVEADKAPASAKPRAAAAAGRGTTRRRSVR